MGGSGMPKKIKIVLCKLGQKQALGTYNKGKNLIEIDQRLKGKRFISTLIHEGLHVALESMTEEEVLRIESIVADIVWRGLKEKESKDKENG